MRAAVRGTDIIGDVHKAAAGHSLVDPKLTARVMGRLREHRTSET